MTDRLSGNYTKTQIALQQTSGLLKRPDNLVQMTSDSAHRDDGASATPLSVPQVLLDDVFQRLIIAEPLVLLKKELHRLAKPDFGLIGAVRRDKNVFEFVDRIAGGNRLFLEDIQARTLDSLFSKRAHQLRLVNYRSAANVDDHRIRLHGRKGSIADHVARLSRQRRRHHDIVALSKQLREFVRLIELVDERVGRRRRVPLERENAHPHGVYPACNCSANVAITHDSHGLAVNLFDQELLPAARLLVAKHAPKILREIENCSERKLAERL